MKDKDGFPRIALILIIVGLIFAGLVVGGVVTAMKKAKQNQQTMKEFKQVSEDINRDMQAKIGKEDMVEGSTEKAKQIQDAMGKTASKLSGDDAKTFRAGERFMGLMQSSVAGYEKAYSAFVAKGGVAPGSLTSSELITERLALLTTFEAANKTFLEFLKGAESKFRTELAKEDFPASKMDETARGFREGGNIDTLLAIRGTDAELCVAMSQYLELLKREWGKWKMNEESKVIFQNSGAADEFNGYARKIKEVADRQAELQKKVLQSRKPGHGAAAP